MISNWNIKKNKSKCSKHDVFKTLGMMVELEYFCNLCLFYLIRQFVSFDRHYLRELLVKTLLPFSRREKLLGMILTIHCSEFVSIWIFEKKYIFRRKLRYKNELNRCISFVIRNLNRDDNISSYFESEYQAKNIPPQNFV